MIPRAHFQRPPEIEEQTRYARRLEWITIAFLVTIIVAIYFTMGSSQAMKAAWIEDMLSLIPPIAFLIASRVVRKQPDERFPWGYERAMSIAFLVGSGALLLMGLFMIWDSSMGLLRQEHPTLGHKEMFGVRMWSGWWMIAALAYSAIPPLILGRMKMKPARKLHSKALVADAEMNKADWLTAGAGIAGILGIGAGLWWADSVAALVISGDIVKDGFGNLKQAVLLLMDQRPKDVEGKEFLDLERDVERALEELDWVESAEVRLREDGEPIVGEAWIEAGSQGLTRPRTREAERVAREVHWRLHDVTITYAHDDDGSD